MFRFPADPNRVVDVNLDELNVHELAALADMAERFNSALDSPHRGFRSPVTVLPGRGASRRVLDAFETGLRQLGLLWRKEHDMRDGDSYVVTNPTGAEIPRYPVPTPGDAEGGLPGPGEVGPRSYSALSTLERTRARLAKQIRDAMDAEPHAQVFHVGTRFDGLTQLQVEGVLQELADRRWGVAAVRDPESGRYDLNLTRPQ